MYDITEFVASHPGGKDKIMQAAGGALEPFWELYTVHYTTAWDSISALLETYRIGSLADPDPAAAAEKKRRGQHEKRTPGLWDDEPARHPGLIVRGERPFNAEAPLQALGDAEVTPKGLHYVRNHHPVPVVADGTHMLRVEVPRGDGTVATLSFTADELRARFPKHVVRATIQCGGNRRGQLGTAGKTMGLQWSAGAISTADWGGARLKDVLGAAGLTEDEAERCGVRVPPPKPQLRPSVPPISSRPLSHRLALWLHTHRPARAFPQDLCASFISTRAVAGTRIHHPAILHMHTVYIQVQHVQFVPIDAYVDIIFDVPPPP